MGFDSGIVSSQLVKGGHLIEQLQQIRLPAVSLSSHLQAVRPDRDPSGQSPRQLVDVEVTLRVDANHYVMAVGHHAAQADALPAELDSQRGGKVVELVRAATVSILDRPQPRIPLLLFFRPLPLPPPS